MTGWARKATRRRASAGPTRTARRAGRAPAGPAPARARICGAYENRAASVRVPGGSLSARRVEHRVAGGDVNPYLFLAAVLGSALIGIEDGLEPPPPITGNAYDQDPAPTPDTWDGASAKLARRARVRRLRGPRPRPPPPTPGNAYDQDLAQIPDTWEAAIDTFETSELVRRIFAPQ